MSDRIKDMTDDQLIELIQTSHTPDIRASQLEMERRIKSSLGELIKVLEITNESSAIFNKRLYFLNCALVALTLVLVFIGIFQIIN